MYCVLYSIDYYTCIYLYYVLRLTLIQNAQKSGLDPKSHVLLNVAVGLL